MKIIRDALLAVVIALAIFGLLLWKPKPFRMKFPNGLEYPAASVDF